MSEHCFTPEEDGAWLDSLPKKPIASKVIFTSDRGNILLVKPIYKPNWQFPGGVVEKQEEPIDAALREIKEEIGLSLGRAALALAGSAYDKNHDNLILVYECLPRLPENVDLTLQSEELSGYKFERPEEVSTQISSYYQEFWLGYAPKTCENR